MAMSQTQASNTDSGVQALIVALLVLIAIPFVMMAVMMPMMGVWGFGHMSGWMWNGTGTSWGWIVMWLILLGVILGGGYLLYRALRTPRTGSDPALESLRTAYARGDLSDEEFERRRERLKRD